MWVSGGRTGAMVTLNHLSVDDPDDGSPLLPEVATPTPVKQPVALNTDSREFFLSRYISADGIFTVFCGPVI